LSQFVAASGTFDYGFYNDGEDCVKEVEEAHTQNWSMPSELYGGEDFAQSPSMWSRLFDEGPSIKSPTFDESRSIRSTLYSGESFIESPILGKAAGLNEYNCRLLLGGNVASIRASVIGRDQLDDR